MFLSYLVLEDIKLNKLIKKLKKPQNPLKLLYQLRKNQKN